VRVVDILFFNLPTIICDDDDDDDDAARSSVSDNEYVRGSLSPPPERDKTRTRGARRRAERFIVVAGLKFGRVRRSFNRRARAKRETNAPGSRPA